VKIDTERGCFVAVTEARIPETAALLRAELELLEQGGGMGIRKIRSGGPDGRSCWIAFVGEDEWPVISAVLERLAADSRRKARRRR
jgi:hypothetical protein